MLKPLFKRSSIYFVGLTAGKLLSTIVFILFARALLPAYFGNFVFFITLLQIITFFSDFGLNQWYQKQADSEDKTALFGKVLKARLYTLATSVVASVSAACAQIFPYRTYRSF